MESVSNQRQQGATGLRRPPQVEWSRNPALLEYSSDVIAVLAADGAIQYNTPSVAQLLGYGSEELIGRCAFDLVHPDDRGKVRTALRSVRAHPGAAASTEFRFRHRDGRWVEIEAVGNSGLRDERLRGVIVNLRDITARKRAEQDRAVLLDVARDVSGTPDLRDMLQSVHRRMIAALPCERVATYLWDARENVLRAVEGHGAPEIPRAKVAPLLFSPSEPTVRELVAGRSVVINDIGAQRWVPVELLRCFHLTAVLAAPLLARGRLTGVLMAARTLPGCSFGPRETQLVEGVASQVAAAIETATLYEVQQREMEIAGALARVGQEILAVAETSVLLDRLCRLTAEVLRCDVSHTFLWQPEERVFVVMAGHGDAPEHREALAVLRVPRDRIHDLIDWLDRDGLVQVGARTNRHLLPAGLQAGYGVTTGLFVALRRGGEIIGIQSAGYRERDEPFDAAQERLARGIAHLASLALNNARLLDQLERVNRLKSDFVATMSHELRTPLSVIMGYADLLLEGSFGALSTEQTMGVRRVCRSAGELLDLINATLDLSRLETGRVPVTLAEIEIGVLIDAIDAETQEARQKRGVSFAWEVEPGLPRLRTDLGKLKVVVKNLIANALKFTEKGRVVTRVSALDEGMELAVMDTGIGIAPEALSWIFEPFRQVDGSPTRRYGGVGLGLYIVRRLLVLLGGTVAVESEVGRGSTFRIWVPNAIDPRRGVLAAPLRSGAAGGRPWNSAQRQKRASTAAPG